MPWGHRALPRRCWRLRCDGSVVPRRRDARPVASPSHGRGRVGRCELPSEHEHPVVTNTPRWVRNVLRDHPGAADGLLAAVLAIAALVSVKAVYDEMSDMDALFRVPRAFPIVLSMLALAAPL